MEKIRNGIIIFSLLFVCISTKNAFAENEPNDSFSEAEEIIDNYVLGNVYDLIEDDEDFYKILVPGDTILTIKIKKLSVKDHSITINGYDNNQEESGVYAYVSIINETDSDKWYNSQKTSQYHYIIVEGNGDYNRVQSHLLGNFQEQYN